MAKKRTGAKSQSRKTKERVQTGEDAKREENARKTRMMGNAFLYALLSIIALFCLYTVIRTLFFTAPSVSELRSDYLFISLVAIPYLIVTAAVILRKLRKKAREKASAPVRRAENLLFAAVVIFAMIAFGYQISRGRSDVSGHKACTGMQQALEQSGFPVREAEQSAQEGADAQPEQVVGLRSILEKMSIERELLCGETAVTMNYHEAGSGVLSAFRRQTAASYGSGEVQTESNGVAVSYWYDEDSGMPRRKAAVCAHTDKAVLIFELDGSPDQAAVLKPLLLEAAGKILGQE